MFKKTRITFEKTSLIYVEKTISKNSLKFVECRYPDEVKKYLKRSDFYGTHVCPVSHVAEYIQWQSAFSKKKKKKIPSTNFWQLLIFSYIIFYLHVHIPYWALFESYMIYTGSTYLRRYLITCLFLFVINNVRKILIYTTMNFIEAIKFNTLFF